MRERMKKKKNMIIGGLLAVVFLMSVGYAAFASNLSITGTANTSSWMIKITNIQEKSKTSGASTVSTSYTDLTANFNCSLTQPGDSITYELTVTNNGTFDGLLENVTTNIDKNNYITVKTLGMGASGSAYNDKIYAGESKKMYIEITFEDNDISSLTETITTNISLTLNYSQADSNMVNKEVTMIWDAKNDTEPTAESIQLTDPITLPQTPIRFGYDFGGWYSRVNGKGVKAYDGEIAAHLYDTAQTKTDDSFTVYAYWVAKKYNVSYDTQGGSSLATSKFSASAKNLVKSIPRRQGYTFKEWNTKADGTGMTVTNDNTPIELLKYLGLDDTAWQTITLYAIWIEN